MLHLHYSELHTIVPPGFFFFYFAPKMESSVLFVFAIQDIHLFPPFRIKSSQSWSTTGLDASLYFLNVSTGQNCFQIKREQKYKNEFFFNYHSLMRFPAVTS